MNIPLFLFCGGPPIDGDGRPKPLMRVKENRSLIIHFLNHLQSNRQTMPAHITLLCDDGQEANFAAELYGFSYPVSIRVQACGPQASTLKKFEQALQNVTDHGSIVQFGYPDIFFFGEFPQPDLELLKTNSSVHISAAALTSRFPRLTIDVYNNEIKGISNYSSPVPANPMHVFGGDLWGRVDELLVLLSEFKLQAATAVPSLEYDFFFWLINHKKMRCVMLYGDRIWVDSVRDINHLLKRTELSHEIL